MEKDLISIKSGIQELGIFEKNCDAWVSTRDVSKLFSKDHADILHKIKNEILPHISDDFVQGNFRSIFSKDSYGRKQPIYLLNRKSFSMVVMGFTGRKAMMFKEAYIEAFEAMWSVIETRQISKSGYREMSSAISKKYNSDPRTFATESNMINQIVLGMTAQDFKSVNNVDKNGNTRDSVAYAKLVNLDKAQRLNSQLIIAGMDFYSRKKVIETNYKRK